MRMPASASRVGFAVIPCNLSPFEFSYGTWHPKTNKNNSPEFPATTTSLGI